MRIRRPSKPFHTFTLALAIAVSSQAEGEQHPTHSSSSEITAPSQTSLSDTDSPEADRLPVDPSTAAESPDLVAEFIGGIAARIRTLDGTPMPGDLFLLMATEGSSAKAHLFDQTPFTHDRGIAIDTLQSNRAAAATVTAITAVPVDVLDLTTAPGGGPSGGITYVIAYLNIISDGAFTGGLRVAATGRLESDGYVHPILAIDEKTAAAHLADADVLFTPSMPSDELADTHGGRIVGELFRARNTGSPLADERKLENYHRWGTQRSDEMDIVGIRHIGDVAAYLCGTGSDYACDIVDTLADQVIADPNLATGSNNGTDTSDTRIR